MDQNKIKKIFYDLVKDGQNGFSFIMNEMNYVRFNYYENGNFWDKNMTDEEYLGSEEKVKEEYEAESSNGMANYIPLLKVDDKDKFFELLEKYINCQYELYDFNKINEMYKEDDSIKSIILTALANARYQDYNNPIEYLQRSIDFFKGNALSKYNNTEISEQIPFLENAVICATNKKDDFGFETPYKFSMSLKVGNEEYKLPSINYGISQNTCYIYSIQNKDKNEENPILKKINRKFYKVNEGLENDTDLDTKDTILGTTPSFAFTMSVFMKVLKENNIDMVRVHTLLPDRYMEKIGTNNDWDADKIQSNLTEKMVLLCYRLQEHFKNIEVNYPINDGYSIIDDKNIGEDVILKLPEKMETDNPLLKDVIESIRFSKKLDQKDDDERE